MLSSARVEAYQGKGHPMMTAVSVTRAPVLQSGVKVWGLQEGRSHILQPATTVGVPASVHVQSEAVAVCSGEGTVSSVEC